MGWIISKALYEKWPCSQEQGVVSSEGIYSDGKQSALLSGSHTQLAYLSQDKMKAFSRLSRFGMMFKPLTESRGEDLLTWYREDFLAKTYPAPERAQELKEADQECGGTWHELSMKYDLDSHSWRIHRSLFPEDLSPSLVTLPKWGMMRDGALFQHLTAERPISGTESGLWLGTPTASMSERSEEFAKGRLPTPAEFAKWPTPSSCSAMVHALRAVRWRTPTVGMVNQDRATDPKYKSRLEAKGQTVTLAAEVLEISGGGHLNPKWVEWLMAWPLGWTDLKPLEMDKFHAWQQQLSES